MNKKHGRRSAVPETSSHANNDNVFILGLKPPDEKNFHPSVEVVQSEYAHRFLEQLGVKPTNKTLEMVHKSVPLTDKCLKANLRAKGHVEDELHITVPHVKHDFKVPTIADPIEILQLGMFNASKATAAAGASSASDRVMSGESMEVKEPAGSLFKRLASSYIYPLNLDAGIAKERLDRFAEITKAKLRTQDVDPVNSVHCVEKEGSGGGRTSFSLVRQTTLQHSLMGASHEKKDVGIDMDMAEELLRNLNVTPEIVLTVLSQLESALTDWYKAQAPETLKGRLSHQEFVDTLELISCDNGMQFYITCINFMYEEYVRGSPSYPHHLESKVTHPPPHPTHEKKKRGSLIAGSILTKGQALQKYDNGYALFVKSRMKDRNDAQARLASGRKTGRNTATARFSSIPIGPQSKDAAASSTATYRAGLVIDMSRRGDLNHTSSNHSKVVFKEQGGSHEPTSMRESEQPMTSHSVRSERRPGGFASSVSFAVKPGSGGESRPASDSDSKDPLDSTEDHMRLISASPSVRRSMRHLVSFSSAVSATQSMIVLKGMKAGDLKELQQARLFSLQQEFAEIYQEQRATRAGMFFKLPIFLLSIRLLISMLFTSLFTMWVATPEGSDALEKMDQALLLMFDPHEYLQRNLSLIQSSPAAVSILAKHPHLSHESETVHFNDTSALLRAALTNPKSAGARKLMCVQPHKTSSKAPKNTLKTSISQGQQDALFHDAHRHILLEKQRRPALAQLGEPVQEDKRAGWLGSNQN